ncbi:hypothetical protein PHYSODRAFT_488630 [Phytophthora sojae]|uniref:DUF4246 domain-containing protein n=1 Tax=Phytophthora sojae (strain P6497) TaxID=1094619 RepID=G4Z544_PHYSP|nr:hypothetical protein PHYSODRAFT_488630 [Phytophthora sojae]EGZ19490.1 hypothetical protein PHYSODRAFT_488630 [Phytophthora sojae]|eukprot:XP_009522207.1 hypothetical protein PHYSODRAFT_488630 [Phytophthora sojae]
MEPRPLLELNVKQAIASILQKPRWWVKWSDSEIRSRWLREVELQLLLKTFEQSLTGWYLELVASRAKLSATTDPAQVVICSAGVDGVWISDNIVSDEVAAKLRQEVAALENVPEEEKDWHPHSKKQVLDLVHPALFCCVFGQTLKAASALDPLPFTTPAEQMHRLIPQGCDTNYQWIPTNFFVNDGGEPGKNVANLRILSYINNLHPEQRADLYDTIGKIFGVFVPLFERMLGDQEEGMPRSAFRVNMQGHDTYRELPPRPKIPALKELPNNPAVVSLRGKQLQVIVKIAEIILTPEKPKYRGGSWHIEGSPAERIVGTGIYYFSCENVKNSRLSFRTEVEEPPYQQNDDEGVAEIYGLFSNSLLVQELGSVETLEARCVVFPNTLQHQVQPFELDDPTKPGARKILGFFLVDPDNSIPSTSIIPPQQEEWMETPMNFTDLDVVEQNIRSMLPRGLSWQEAKRHRLKLMKERAVPEPDEDERDGNPRYFSLCEH